MEFLVGQTSRTARARRCCLRIGRKGDLSGSTSVRASDAHDATHRSPEPKGGDLNVERAKLGNLLCRLAEEWRRWIAELTNPARATAVQGPAEKAEFAALIEEANREFVLTTKVLLT